MAAELGLLYLTQHQKLAQSQQNHQHQHTGAASGSMRMWNSKQAQEDDDSWEVRAFAEDTGNAMGTTWPPRSYTCTFCRREFRSAQALGGHMNVHRRDRARLHQGQPPGSSSINGLNPSVASTSSSPFIIPNSTNDPLGSGLPGKSLNFSAVPPHEINSSSRYSSNAEPGSPVDNRSNITSTNVNMDCKESENEEIDLELRLGHGPTTSPSSSS